MKFVIFIFLFGLSFAELAHSETNDEQDHPSWSSGLPERDRKVKKLDKPTLNLEDADDSEEAATKRPDLQIEVGDGDFGLEPQAPDLSEIKVKEGRSGFLGLFKGDGDNDLDDEDEDETEYEDTAFEAQPQHEPEQPKVAKQRMTGRKKRAMLQAQLRAEEKSKQQRLSKNTAEDEAHAKLIEQNSKKYRWKIIKQAKLEYPRNAARKNLEGWVDVRVTVNEQGKVVNAHAEKYSEQGKIFVAPALKSLRKYHFDPPSKQDINTNVNRVYRIEFKF